MTKDLISLSRRKAKLYRIKQNKPTEDNCIAYKQLNNEFNKLKRHAKVDFYNKILSEHKCNSKKIWSILNQAIGKSKTTQRVPQKIIFDGKEVCEENAISEMFNQYFKHAGTEVIKNIPKTNLNPMAFMPPASPNSLFC